MLNMSKILIFLGILKTNWKNDGVNAKDILVKILKIVIQRKKN